MSHEAQSSKYKHNTAGGPLGGNPMGGMGMGMNMNPMGMNPMGANPMGNMMGAGGGGNGFDPNAMAAMYQKMMMSKLFSTLLALKKALISIYRICRHDDESHDDEHDEPE
jgi:hypothetical protein